MKTLLLILGLITLASAIPLRGKECQLINVDSLDRIPAPWQDWKESVVASNFWDGPNDLVTPLDALYDSRQTPGGITTVENQCICPAVVHPTTVLFGDIRTASISPNGTLCAPHEHGCLKLGHSISGHKCLGYPTDDITKCVTRRVILGNCDTYTLLETTHAPVCVCNPTKDGNVANSYSTGISIKMPRDATGYETGVFNMLVHDRADNDMISGPVSCTGAPLFTAAVRKVITTADKHFHIVSVSTYRGRSDFHSVECVGFDSDENQHILARIYVKLPPTPKCECNNRSMAELYKQYGYVVDEHCEKDICVCQPGWGGNHCEQCMYSDVLFGCEQKTKFIWCIIVLLSVIVLLIATIVVLLVTRKTVSYVYSKLKKVE